MRLLVLSKCDGSQQGWGDVREMGPTGCPEKSATNYHCILCNIPEQHWSHWLWSRSLQSCVIKHSCTFRKNYNHYAENIRCHHTKFCLPGNQAPTICAQLKTQLRKPNTKQRQASWSILHALWQKQIQYPKCYMHEKPKLMDNVQNKVSVYYGTRCHKFKAVQSIHCAWDTCKHPHPALAANKLLKLKVYVEKKSILFRNWYHY